MARYIGLDVHLASCTMVVVGESGKKLACHVVETNVGVLIELIKAIPKPRFLCFEEGTQSAWLYEKLSPYTNETIVTVQDEKQLHKDDERDAFNLANRLRTGAIKIRVYKKVGPYGRLRELTRVHQMQVNDSVRIQNRIKSMFRARGLTADDQIYDPVLREQWIKKLPEPSQPVAWLLLRQFDAVEPLRDAAEKACVQEARKHAMFKILKSIPGLGDIRVARLMAIVVSPCRFRTRQQLWKYAGLAIVKWSSSDWEPDEKGKLRKHKVEQTRGLNRNHNHPLKDIFKGAATTVITHPQDNCPLYAHYQQMLINKIDPDLAKLTISRQIAAITLAIWKKESVYDPANLKKTT